MKLKRMMAIVLCFAMVLSTMSFSVFAEDATVTVDAEVNNTTSGSIAGNVTVEGTTEPPVVNANVKIGDQGYNTLADALEATREMSGDVVIELLADANLSYGAREAYGKDDATSITINGNNNTLTLKQTDSDWSSIGMANADGVFKMNNVNVVKTGYGVPGGAWNTHAINFNVNTELTNVDFDNSIKVSGTSVLTNVNIVEDEEFYGIWIPANATSVTINGGSITATNNGRGIKIADQYVEDSAQKVSLTVDGMTFETAKKAAVLVSSKGGADITTTNCDITKVAADSENFAWVDEDWTSSADKVTVDGGSVFVEGTTIINNIDDLKAFRDDVNAGNTYEDKYVMLANDINLTGENWTPIGNDTNYFWGTFDGGNHTISNMTINIDTTGNVFAGLFGGIKKATVKNLKMTNVDIDVVGAKVRAAAVVGIAHSNSESRTDATINFENITVDGCIIKARATSGSALLGGVVGYSYPANMKNIVVSDLDINGNAEASNGEIRAAAINGYVCGQNISNNGGTRAPMLVDTFEVSNATINAEGYTVFAGGYAPYTYYGYITLKDGNINGLKITADAHEAFVGGLVGYFWRSDNGHTVENVDITGIDFDVTTDYLGETRIGGVVGTSQSPNTKYNDVTVSGKIVERCSDSANPVNYHAKVGGFVARTYEYAQQTYTNCVADVDVTGTNVVGGFVGNHNSTVSYANCEAKGDVTGDIAGGFAGRLTEHGYTTDVTFDGCKASGTVTGTNVAGGFIGSTANHGWAAWAAGNGTAYGKNITLKDCVAAENVITINNTSYCAGVVGEAKVADSKELTLDNITYSVEPAFYPAVTNVTVKTKVAQLGNEKFETLAAAITAAQPNDTIVLLANITEDVTVNKSITIDGGNFKYTGNISVSGTTSEVTVKNVNFVDGTGYAITTNRIKSITVEDCTVNNYGFGFLYANKSTPTVVVKNVTVDGGNYGFHWVYGTSATLEDVTMTNVTNGLFIQNYADKNLAIKNCNISGTNPIFIWERTNATGVQTFVFEGINSLGETEFTISDYAKLKLADAESVLKACEGLTVTSDNEKYNVTYEDDAYKVEKVAKIGEKKYITLQDALADAKDGDIITLIWNEGDAPIAMNGYVSGKTVTITGTAEVDWEKDFLFVGRTNDGTEALDAKLIFENATLTTTAGGDHGIHVSGAEKGSVTKANGTVEIKNSKINLTYLINKGAINLDNSTLTVKSGFSVGGRPASETESGEDATATIDLTNNSKVIVNNHNGMGLGYEAIGIMNIDESSAFECTQDFLITAKGTMNVNGTVNVTGALNVKGTLASRGDIYGEIVKASDDAVIEIHAGVYSYDPTDYIANGLQVVYDDVTKLYTVIGTHTINIEATPAECYDEQTVKVTVEVNGADFANAEWKLTYNKDVVKYVDYEDNTNGIDEVSPKVSEGVIEDKLYTHTAGDPFKGNTVLVTYIFETRSQNSDDVKAVFTLSDAVVATWFSSNFDDTGVDGDSAEVVVKRRNFEGITISDTANGQTIDITNKIVEDVYAIHYDGFAHEFAVDTSAEDETINYVITKDGAAVTEILAKGTYEIEYTIEKLGYKTFTGSFKVVIGDPDFVLETSTYTLENYTLVMVYMNAKGMAPTFGGKQMYDITSSGYTYQANSTDEGTPYKFVYGIVIPEPEVSEDLTLKVAFNTADAIEIPSYDEDVNFVGGVTDRDAVVTINTYKGNKGQLEDYNLLSRVLKADVDKNKKVNIEDVTMVERAAAK